MIIFGIPHPNNINRFKNVIVYYFANHDIILNIYVTVLLNLSVTVMAQLKIFIEIGETNLKSMVNIWKGGTGEKIGCNNP